MLEPTRVGCTVVVGPKTSNFVDHVKILTEANAIEEIQSIGGLIDFVALMLSEPYFRKKGEHAAEFVNNLEKPSADLFTNNSSINKTVITTDTQAFFKKTCLEILLTRAIYTGPYRQTG